MSQDSNWAIAYQTANCLHAQLVAKHLTENHNIEAVVLNKQDSSYHFGRCEILVLKPQLTKAEAIIFNFNNG
jgi:hypothetical protein